MELFIRNEGEKQYRRASLLDYPEVNPKKGWKAGKRYRNYYSHAIYTIDKVDTAKDGTLRLHVTKKERKRENDKKD